VPGLLGIFSLAPACAPEHSAARIYQRLEHGKGWFGLKCLLHGSGFHGAEEDQGDGDIVATALAL